MSQPSMPSNRTNSMLSDLSAAGVTEHFADQYRAVVAEQATRSIESLRLYRPMPFQDAFHRCRVKECLLLKGNQAGGSVAGFIEDARAATGSDPYGKYPKENGVIACIGFGEKHIGRVIHRYLFRAGAFRMIRDKTDKLWRVFRPWGPEELIGGLAGDGDREADAKLAPPFIPARMIEDIAWDKRSENVFSQVKLKNGWIIYAANSAGDPGQFQGTQVDLAHIDEDTATAGWYPELLNRCSVRRGLMRWTALPHLKNNEMVDVLERAMSDETVPDPTTVVLRATAYDNIYYPKESKIANEKILKQMGNDVWRQRMLGEIVLDSVLMYPTFTTSIHDALKDQEPRSQVQKILTERNGEPPEDWTRYAIVDPGHTVCAVTFFTTPPPELGNYRIQYAELYLRQCTASRFAAEFLPLYQDHTFESFIIDMHGGSLRELGTGILPVTQYTTELAKLKITSSKTGSNFIPGCDDVAGRRVRLREALGVQRDGTTEYMLVVKRCPATVAEFKRYKKKTVLVNGVAVPTDEGDGRNIHAIDCVEMAIAHGLPYVKPVHKSKGGGIMDWLFSARQERAERLARKNGSHQSGVITLGPS